MLSSNRKKRILTKLANAVPLRGTGTRRTMIVSGGDADAKSTEALKKRIHRGGKANPALMAKVRPGMMSKTHTPSPTDRIIVTSTSNV